MQFGRDGRVLETSWRWARDEGWEPGLDDQRAFATVDSAGWFAATDLGEIVTTLAAVRYDESFGFLGLYITRPESRGQAIGRTVWAMGRQYLDPCASVGLDGVVAREAMYASDGFQRAHLTARYAGSAADLLNSLAEHGSDRLVDAASVGAESLAAFELAQSLFPTNRSRFLDAWLTLDQAYSLAVLDDDGQPIAWGTIRRSVSGWRVGPLFALDPITARTVIRGLLLAASGGGLDPQDVVYVDVPEPNQDAVALMSVAGFTEVFACIRMYRGVIPKLDLERIYANTTFELG